mmetsp:Transcript_8188/g.20460  ORF Transcript_8188/g.20460 Transcript_8188/m.20460 type:complete len:232 (+) Transcript_8188:1875-2570(+)
MPRLLIPPLYTEHQHLPSPQQHARPHAEACTALLQGGQARTTCSHILLPIFLPSSIRSTCHDHTQSHHQGSSWLYLPAAAPGASPTLCIEHPPPSRTVSLLVHQLRLCRRCRSSRLLHASLAAAAGTAEGRLGLVRSELGAEEVELLGRQRGRQLRHQLAVHHHVEPGHLLDLQRLKDRDQGWVGAVQLAPHDIGMLQGQPLDLGVHRLAHIAIRREELGNQQPALAGGPG